MTTVRVEYGKAVLFELDSAQFGVLDQNFLGVGEVPVDVSDRVVSLSVRRGRQDALEPTRAGNASVTLRNLDGELDPLNTASALYPGVEPARSLNIWADDIQVFAGIVDDIDLAFDPSGDAVVQVQASDRLSTLALAEFPPAGLAVGEEDSGQRVTDVLASDADFWTDGTDIATGDSTLAAGTATGNVVQYLNTVARSEGGVLFVGRDGDLVFRNRLFAVTATPVVLSDDGGDVPYEALVRQTSGESLRTVAFGERNGSRRERTSTLGLLRFGFRALDLGELLLLTDTDVDERLDFELALRSQPNPPVREVRVSQERVTNTAVLGLELGDPVEVEFSPPNVAQITEEGVVLNLRHDFTVGAGWRTTVGMRPAELSGFLILDAGRLDFDALAF
ncbi:MAG TPA: hypothetical protein VIG24_00560 [Acidimicrobiia bacterium]